MNAVLVIAFIMAGNLVETRSEVMPLKECHEILKHKDRPTGVIVWCERRLP